MLKRLSLAPELFPVQALFNAIPENRFVKALQAFLQRTGVGYDEVCCEFSDEDRGGSEYKNINSVSFYIFNEIKTISYNEFFKFLSLACHRQSMEFPEQSGEIQHLLHKIEDALGIKQE